MKNNKTRHSRLLFCFVISALLLLHVFKLAGSAKASIYAGPGSPYYLQELLITLTYGDRHTPEDYAQIYGGYGYPYSAFSQPNFGYSWNQPYGYSLSHPFYNWNQPSYGWGNYNYMFPFNCNPYSYTWNQPSYGGWNQPSYGGGVSDYVYNYPYPFNYNGYQYIPAPTGGVYRTNPGGQISYTGPSGYGEIGPYLY